eukprot:scaffold18046_cov63-Phaeocystis_antarctica.AAC.5
MESTIDPFFSGVTSSGQPSKGSTPPCLTATATACSACSACSACRSSLRSSCSATLKERRSGGATLAATSLAAPVSSSRPGLPRLATMPVACD